MRSSANDGHQDLAAAVLGLAQELGELGDGRVVGPVVAVAVGALHHDEVGLGARRRVGQHLLAGVADVAAERDRRLPAACDREARPTRDVAGRLRGDAAGRRRRTARRTRTAPSATARAWTSCSSNSGGSGVRPWRRSRSASSCWIFAASSSRCSASSIVAGRAKMRPRKPARGAPAGGRSGRGGRGSAAPRRSTRARTPAARG